MFKQYKKYYEQINKNDIDHWIELNETLRNEKNIIHQIWFGIIPNEEEAKKTFIKFNKYSNSWKEKNPNIYYHCWTLKECLIFISLFYPNYISIINSFKYIIQFCDFVRYVILYHYGGLYVDMDYFCNKSFEKIFNSDKYNVCLVETKNKISNNVHVSNSLMYSKYPFHIFWKRLIRRIKYNNVFNFNRHYIIMYTTGPGILNQCYWEEKKEDISFFPYKLFHPFGIKDIKILNNLSKNIYAVHIGKGSWETNDSKILLLLYEKWYLYILILGFLLFVFTLSKN